MDRRNFFKKAGQFSLAAGSTLLLPNAIKSALALDTIDWADAANGATATASSSNGAGFPAAAVTYRPYYSSHAWNAGYCWASGVAPSVDAPQYVDVQFATVANLNKVIVFGVQDVYNSTATPGDTATGTYFVLQDFKVQAWDGHNWQTMSSVVGNNLIKRTITFNKNINTDKIRIIITRVPSTQLACIVAVRAMGTQYIDSGNNYSVIVTQPNGSVSGHSVGYDLNSANTTAASATSIIATNYPNYAPTVSVVHNIRPQTVINWPFQFSDIGGGFADYGDVQQGAPYGYDYGNVAQLYDANWNPIPPSQTQQIAYNTNQSDPDLHTVQTILYGIGVWASAAGAYFSFAQNAIYEGGVLMATGVAAQPWVAAVAFGVSFVSFGAMMNLGTTPTPVSNEYLYNNIGVPLP